MSNEFTDNELKSIAVNAVGRASEAGDKAVMRICLAVPEKFLEEKNKEGKMVKTGRINYPPKYIDGKPNPESLNSGFSFGIFQWDIGQKKNGEDIIKAYNDSEYVTSGQGKKIDKIDEYALVLQQNRDIDMFGKENSTKDRIDIRWGNKEYRENITQRLNAFFNTDEGYEYVMSLQEEQYKTNLKPVMEKALKSKSVQNMNKEDTAEVLAAVAKLKNQTNDNINAFLNDEKNIHTKQEILDKIKDTYKDDVDKSVTKAVEGAELYNILEKDEGKLGEIFREQNKKNPFEVINFHESPDAQLLDAMFRHPERAKDFIDKVNNGEDYVINIDKEAGNMGIEKEAYIVGVRDGTIFTMQETVADKKVTGSSKGFKLEDGEWKEFDNNKEKFVELKNDNWKPISVKKELSSNVTASAQEQLGTEILSNDLKAKLLIAQNIFGMSDKEFTCCISTIASVDKDFQKFIENTKTQEETKSLNKSGFDLSRMG